MQQGPENQDCYEGIADRIETLTFQPVGYAKLASARSPWRNWSVRPESRVVNQYINRVEGYPAVRSPVHLSVSLAG